MDYEFIKSRLAPCGLHCGKCFAFAEGDIRKTSVQLSELLGQFDRYAERFVDLLDEPVFAKYGDFKAMLAHFTEGSCKGCRKEQCKLFSACKVRNCHEEKKVDFCFQCNEFPCNKTGFDENLQKRSVEINWRMQKIGVENYYEEIKDKPRY